MSRFMHWSYQLEELLFPLRPFERIVNQGQHMLTLLSFA